MPNPTFPRGSPAKFSDRSLPSAAQVKLPAPARFPLGPAGAQKIPMQPSTPHYTTVQMLNLLFCKPIVKYYY